MQDAMVKELKCFVILLFNLIDNTKKCCKTNFCGFIYIFLCSNC